MLGDCVLEQVQGELALFLARCASLSLEDWGATNAKMLRDAKVTTHKHDLDQRALGGGTVLNNLVRLLGERTHRRARYHAVLALANLADDYMLTVPPCVVACVCAWLACSSHAPWLCCGGRSMVYAGVLPACVVVLRNPRSPHSLVRQVMRILKAVASFPMGAPPLLAAVWGDACRLTWCGCLLASTCWRVGLNREV